MIYLKLFYEFFRVGLFSFGGGYATLPFLYEISVKYNWYTLNRLSDMIGVASITPGPVGINVATFAGFTTANLLGAFVATSAIIIPSYIIVIIVSKMLDNYRKNPLVKSIIGVLKPVCCGMLAAVAINMFISNVKDLFAIILFVVLLSFSVRQKRDPIFYLGISALAGILFGIFNLINI